VARDLKQLTVFISGTDDVDAEKAALRLVVGELNKQLEKRDALTLRAISWPDDVRPGVNTDPQAEISRQLGEDFDIYVGLLGTRFGTPTRRAGSGTEEEFDRAMSKFRENSQSIRVLFYFKRAIGDPFTLDIAQLQKVRHFRESLSSRGVLYRDFGDTAEFAELARDHIYNLVIEEWQGTEWSLLAGDRARSEVEVPRTDSVGEDGGADTGLTPHDTEEHRAAELPAHRVPEDEEEQGFLDYMSGFHAAADAMREVMTRISTSIVSVNERIRSSTVDTEALLLQREKQAGKGQSQREFVLRARQIVDDVAADLDVFASAMAPSVGQYRFHSRELFAQLRSARNASPELRAGGGDEDRHALAELIEMLRGARGAISGFQATIGRVPPLTGKLKRARERTAEVLGEFVAEMSFTVVDATQLLDELDGGPTGAAAA